MNTEKYNRGLARQKSIMGEAGNRLLEAMHDAAPEMARYAIEFSYGYIYSRPLINDRIRQIVAITDLAA